MGPLTVKCLNIWKKAQKQIVVNAYSYLTILERLYATCDYTLNQLDSLSILYYKDWELVISNGWKDVYDVSV